MPESTPPFSRLANSFTDDPTTGGVSGAFHDIAGRGVVGGLADTAADLARPVDWAGEKAGVDLWDDRWYHGDVLEGSMDPQSDGWLAEGGSALVRDAVRFLAEEYLARGAIKPGLSKIAPKLGVAEEALKRGTVLEDAWKLVRGGAGVNRTAQALKAAETLTAYGSIGALQSRDGPALENAASTAGEFVVMDLALGLLGKGIKALGKSSVSFFRATRAGKELTNAAASLKSEEIAKGFGRIMEMSDADLKAARDAGRLAPDLADSLIANKYDPAAIADPRYATDGPARSRFQTELVGAGGDAKVVDAAMAMHDAFATLRARVRGTGSSVDEYYGSLSAAADGSAAGPIRGVTEFLKDGGAVVKLFQSADASTIFHESSHIFRRRLGELSNDLATAADKWVGAEAGAQWSRPQEEAWANAFEKYLMEGSAPTKGMETIFEATKTWLLHAYADAINSPAMTDFDPKVKDIFDQMLGGIRPADMAKNSGLRVGSAITDALAKGANGVDALAQGAKVPLNLDHIKTTADAEAILKDLEKPVLAAINAAKGDVQKHAEVVRIAEQYDLKSLVPDLLSADANTSNLAGRVVAGKMVLVSLVEDASPLITRFKTLDAAKNFGAEYQALQGQIAHRLEAAGRVEELVGRINREGGRLISAGNINVAGRRGVGAQTATDVLAAWRGETAETAALGGGKGIASGSGAGGGVTAPGARAPTNFINAINAIHGAVNAGQTAKAAKVVNPKHPLWRAALELFTANLLSGMKTHVANFSGNVANAIQQPLSRAVGELVARRPNPQAALEALSMYQHYSQALMDMVRSASVKGKNFQGLRAVGKTFSLETSWFERNVEGINGPAFRARPLGIDPGSGMGKTVDFIGKAVRSISLRPLAAVDDLFTNLSYIASVRMEATAQAKQLVSQGLLSPDKIGKHVEDVVESAFHKGGAAAGPDGGPLFANAYKYAKEVGFKSPLTWGPGKGIEQFKNDHPWLGLIMPFVRTPVNIWRQASRMSPLGYAQHRLEMAMSESAGIPLTPEQITRHRGDVIVGAAVWGSALMLALNGRLTGSGPKAKAERQALEATGWRPYSVVVDGEDGTPSYIAINRIEPVGSVMGMMADGVELYGDMRDGEWEKFTGLLIASYVQNATNKTFTSGISQFFDMVTNPRERAGPYARTQIATLAVPAVVSQFAQAEDSSLREARSILEAVKRRTPWMNDELAPRRNLLGEPITPPLGFVPFVDSADPLHKEMLPRLLSPLAMSRKSTDTVVNEIATLRHGITQPPTTMEGLDLTSIRTESGQQAYDRWIELTGTVAPGGRTAHDMLEALISSPAYQAYPPVPSDPVAAADPSMNMRLRAVQRVLGKYRELARRQLIAETPELRKHLQGVMNTRVERAQNATSALLEKIKN